MRVLVVEDDLPSREHIVDGLKSQNCGVIAASNGREGLAFFEQDLPDLVLSDIRMPGMDGLEMLKEIRDRSPDAIVVLMTAYGCEDYALHALRLGANNYLQKPLRHKELFALIDKYRPVIQTRTIEREIVGKIVERSLTMFVENDLSLVPKIVDRLLIEAGEMIDSHARLGVHLGLIELLTNAIEHGNLGISYHEKSAALEQGTDGFKILYEMRRARRELDAKRVKVDFSMQQKVGCEWTIADQGEGFDPARIPDPTDPAHCMALHGRGIMLSRFQFDEFEYLGKGNVVRIRKTNVPSMSCA